jgi:hypothetical protein
MAEIWVQPDQVKATGNAIAAIGGRVAPIGQKLAENRGAVSNPPLTAHALSQLGTDWSVGTERMGGELMSLGQTAEAAGWLYHHEDETIIAPTPPAGP